MTGTPTSSLRQQLQDALGPAYAIERELAGGGMSRVFVAEETRFGRRVVVKVLAPELVVGLSAERFEREIRLAAQLQQANIVPLFGAGEAGAGLPYYTMPYVEGESLRARLDGRPFHPADAVAILRDVARALEYAHAHGVVHRDIKPENVLLSGGTAVVTDFGIAKALSASKTSPPGGTLTEVGTSLGTPAYMAPEQAVGDEVDARADIYAWGIVAYEMLAGSHPFAGKQTAQQYITAHLAETPPPISDIRTGVHADLSAVVVRALEKDPAKRHQSAGALLQALNSIVTTGASTPPAVRTVTRSSPWLMRSKYSRIVGVAALVTLVLGGLAAFATKFRAPEVPAATSAISKKVMIGAFANRTGDPAIDNVGVLVEQRVSRRLSETGVAELIANPEGAAGATLERARAASAGILVNGNIIRDGEGLQFNVDLVDPANGQIVRSIGPIESRMPGHGNAIAELAERVAGTIALVVDSRHSDAIPAIAAQTPTYAALREFAAGEALANSSNYAAAAANYLAAYRLDSTFTFAGVRAARGYYNSDRCEQADSLSRTLLALGEALSEFERAALERNIARCNGDLLTSYQAAGRMVRLAPELMDARVVFAMSALYLYRPAEALRGLAGTRDDESTRENQSVALHFLKRHKEELDLGIRTERDYPGSSVSYRIRLGAAAGLRDSLTFRRVVNEIASTPAGGRINSLILLQYGAREAMRHGLRSDAARIHNSVLALISSLPARDRGVAYWGVRTESLYFLGRYREASASLDSADALPKEPSLSAGGRFRRFKLAYRARIAAREGRSAEAESALRSFAREDIPFGRGGAKLEAARIAAVLGHRDQAVSLLRQSILEGQSHLELAQLLDATPDLESLYGYPPFEELFKPKG